MIEEETQEANKQAEATGDLSKASTENFQDLQEGLRQVSSSLESITKQSAMAKANVSDYLAKYSKDLIQEARHFCLIHKLQASLRDNRQRHNGEFFAGNAKVQPRRGLPRKRFPDDAGPESKGGNNQADRRVSTPS